MGINGNDGILLTGATGFLGSALLHELIASGRSIIATVRPKSHMTRIAALVGRHSLRLIGSDAPALEAEFARGSIGTIIHAATEYGRGDIPIASILDANLILPVRLAELGINHGAKTFINVDSFFNKARGTYSGLQNYSLSKLSLIDWLERLSPRIGVINAVLEHMYGPFDSRSKFIEAMVQDIAVAQAPSVDLTHGHQRRDFVFITDVVSAIIAVLDYAEKGSFQFKTVGIGTGESMQVRDMVSMIADHSDSSTVLRFGAIPYRSDEIMSSQANTHNLMDLGWKPKVSPSKGIQTIIDCYMNEYKS